MAINWKSEYSVGITEMDGQHKKLIDCITQLNDAMSLGRGKEVIGRILNELVHYTEAHFFDEESLMLKHGYAGLGDHKKLHNELTMQVLKYKNDFESSKTNVSIPLMNFLEKWLVNHIQTVDQKYGRFIAAKVK
jgi:hemerythrin